MYRQVVKVDQQTDGYELQVSTRPIRHRGDTLGGMNVFVLPLSRLIVYSGPVLTVKVHSPTEGVVGKALSFYFCHHDASLHI